MNSEFRDLRGRAQHAYCIVLAAALMALAFQCNASIYTLSAGNTTALINSIGSASSPAGWYDWSVNGVDQLDQHWFYYRVDGGGSGWIDNIAAPTLNSSTATILDFTYVGSSYSARVVYQLAAGTPGSGYSAMNQTTTFQNTSGSSITLHLFDFSHVTLGGTSTGQSVQRTGNSIRSTFIQTAGSLVFSNRFDGGAKPISFLEAALFDQTRNNLTNGVANLNNVTSIGPGDVTSAAQWNTTLAPSQSLIVSELLVVQVPEPSSLALVAVGLLGWAAKTRRNTLGFALRRKQEKLATSVAG